MRRRRSRPRAPSRPSSRLALPLVVVLGATACGTGAGARRDVRAPGAGGAVGEGPAEAAVLPGAFRAGEGVIVLPSQCDGSADDDCDGIDDDCDGHTDDGCGLAGGAVQVVAAWATDADIDLYVIEPQGDTLSFQRSHSMSGGRVDRVGRGACAEGDAPTRVENLVWDGPSVPRGTYRVVLHYWGECQSLAGPTDVTVSVSVGGQRVGTVVYQLSPNELTEVAVFDVQ